MYRTYHVRESQLFASHTPSGLAYNVSWYFHVEDGEMSLLLCRDDDQSLIDYVTAGSTHYEWAIPGHVVSSNAYTLRVVSASHTEESDTFTIGIDLPHDDDDVQVGNAIYIMAAVAAGSPVAMLLFVMACFLCAPVRVRRRGMAEG